MSLKTRVAKLEKLSPPPPPPDPEQKRRQKRANQIWERFLKLVGDAQALMTAEEAQRIAEAKPPIIDERSYFRQWTNDLTHGRWRLPPELSPSVMKELMLA